MPKTHCIVHPARAQLIIIREDYLAICDKNHCAAAILNVFEYWTDVKLDNREQAETENEIAKAGNVTTVDTSLWIYKSIPDLSKELLGLFGVSKIGKALDILKDKGFLDSRNNPKYGWDRTLQYEFQTENVQKAIQALKITHGSVKSKSSKASKTTDRSVKNKAAIPKTTTQPTTKVSTEKDYPVDIFKWTPSHVERFYAENKAALDALTYANPDDIRDLLHMSKSDRVDVIERYKDCLSLNIPIECFPSVVAFTKTRARQEKKVWTWRSMGWYIGQYKIIPLDQLKSNESAPDTRALNAALFREGAG
jgi:hypothetical protein